MNWKSTLGAFLVLVAVGAYYLLVAEPEHKSEVSKEAQKVVLTTFEDKDIQKLEIKKGEKSEPVKAVREGEKRWKIISPVETLGDRWAWDGAARKMAKLKAKRFVKEAPDDLSAFGLDKPRVTVTATAKDGKVVTLLLGNENKFDDTVFAKTADKTRVVTVDKDVFSAVDKDLMALREKRLLDFEQKDVTKFTVEVVHLDGDNKGERGKYTLAREGEKWRLLEPIEDMADKSTASSVLSSIKNLRAESFEKEKVENPAEEGLSEPGIHVEIFIKGKEKPLELWVQKPKEGEEASKQQLLATAGKGHPLAKVKGYIFKNVDKKLFDLRDKSLLEFKRKDVKKITVRDKDKSYTVVGSGEPLEWSIEEPEKAKAKKYKVSSLLSSLSYLKAKEFADENPKDLENYGLDKPDKEITLYNEKGEELARLLIGKADGDMYFAKGAKQKRVSKLDKKSVDRWAWKVDDVKEDKDKK